MKLLVAGLIILGLWPSVCLAQDGGNPGSQLGVAHRYGWLEVKDGQLCSETGEPVQLRGMSSHDLRKFPFAATTVSNLADGWGASVVRAAMYVDVPRFAPYMFATNAVKSIVEQALKADIYVIIDWHMLAEGDPRRRQIEARDWLGEMAREYGSRPNVLFEICNEPNGPGIKWSGIRSYADFVIPAIRSNAPRNIIIVGTDSWSQGVRSAAAAPLSYSNVVYALHFYSGTHHQSLRDDANYALKLKLPIFVSEWGLTDYTGQGLLFPGEAQKWLNWMDQRKISWVNWSFSTCAEGSAALKSYAKMGGPWPDAEVSASGIWVKAHMLRH